jgi:hypothetical protein
MYDNPKGYNTDISAQDRFSVQNLTKPEREAYDQWQKRLKVMRYDEQEENPHYEKEAKLAANQTHGKPLHEEGLKSWRIVTKKNKIRN